MWYCKNYLRSNPGQILVKNTVFLALSTSKIGWKIPEFYFYLTGVHRLPDLTIFDKIWLQMWNTVLNFNNWSPAGYNKTVTFEFCLKEETLFCDPNLINLKSLEQMSDPKCDFLAIWHCTINYPINLSNWREHLLFRFAFKVFLSRIVVTERILTKKHPKTTTTRSIVLLCIKSIIKAPLQHRTVIVIAFTHASRRPLLYSSCGV